MKYRIILSLSLLILLTGCHTSPPEMNPGFETFISQFQDPPREYSTAPFWVWNDSITTDKIDQQLLLFRENGVYQVFIHPRPGLVTEYLSPQWFEMVAYAVNRAKDMGMKTWLYDENSFPSGFAGGHVPASLPPGADLVVGLKMHKFSRLDGQGLANYPVILKKIGNSFANISNGYRNYMQETGDYYAFSKWYYPEDQGLYGGFSYVDLLAYGITERFMRKTMKGYEEYIGREFGKTVPGLFTDEPHIHTNNDPSVIKFTPVLFSRFEETYGYPLENYLPCLFEKTGDWKNVRHDYYLLLLDMFIERWAQPWKSYTDSNGLLWTGHYWEHTWPNPAFVPDNMAMYAWHQVPGIDMLFNDEPGRPDQFGNIRTVKELSSVANQLNKKRTLSETYGGSGWDLSFMDMKRLGDWEYALGVNLLNQHLSYMTLKGARKRDFPLSFSYHSSWWDQYGVLNQYFHRLSFALASGKQVNRVLIIEPTTTAWMYYSPDQGTSDRSMSGDVEKINHSFRNFLDSLERKQVEYDLGSEKIITGSGRVEADGFFIGERKYSLVILPPSFENLEKTTFDLLALYLKNGGKMIISGKPPSHLEGNMSREVRNVFSAYTDRFADIRDSLASADLFPPSFVPLKPETWKGRVFHHRREMPFGDLLFLCNFDTLETATISFRSQRGSAVELDLFTGSAMGYPAFNVDGSLEVHLELPPAGSKLLLLSGNEKKYPSKEFSNLNFNEIKGSETIVKRNGPNAVTLDYCDLELNGRVYRDIYFYNAADTIFKEYLGNIYGFNYNPWSVAVQYRTNILDKNNLLTCTKGYKAHFYFYFRPGFIPDQLEAVLENPTLIDLSLNGEPVRRVPGKWWLDRNFGVYDLGTAIQDGRNELSIEVSPMNVLAELEPVYLIGNFSVYSSPRGWVLDAPAELSPGIWRNQGMPFFSGTVSYHRDFDLKTWHESDRPAVELSRWNGTVAEVIVNEKKAGIIFCPPYRLFVDDLIREGKNHVEVKVYGSLKNLLGPHHNNPVNGFVTPWSFFYAPDHQPPGTAYDLNDYGLMEDFKLVRFEGSE